MLSPEEKQALIEFAGPIFALGKDIDSMYFNGQQSKTDGMRDGGISGAIKNALERDFKSSQAPSYQPPVHQPQPQYVEAPQQPFPTHTMPTQQAEAYIPPPIDENQLELKFNRSEQEKTNELLNKQNKILEKINKKIDKLLALIENG